MVNKKMLKLHSPSGAKPAVFKWPLVHTDTRNGANEIADIIKNVCDDFPELRLAVENCILKDYNGDSFESMKSVCERYNRAIDGIRSLHAGTSLKTNLRGRPSRKLLSNIMQYIYAVSVENADKLNEYEPFSPQVYGETSFELICKMLDEVPLLENDIFIDLGSGVGQVVLQVAALSKCAKCIGIEKSETPNIYATTMEREFRFWMKWYGKTYSDIELIKGDFLSDDHNTTIKNSTFVFVNNFAFGPTVDHQLKMRFQHLREGSKVVSSKPFAPLNFRISHRNLTDIATIMKVSELTPLKGSVSWTQKSVSYYLHIIDRSLLESYFEKHKKRGSDDSQERTDSDSVGGGDSDEQMPMPTVNEQHPIKLSLKLRPSFDDFDDTSATSESSSSTGREEDDVTWGITTRRKWQHYYANDKASTSEDSIKIEPNTTKVKRADKNKAALDLLHRKTVLSTQTSNSDSSSYNELKIRIDADNEEKPFVIEESAVKTESYPELDLLLEKFREQYIDFIKQMRTPEYKKQLEQKVEFERARNKQLKETVGKTQAQIEKLQQDSVKLLKLRLTELGINAEKPVDFINEARGIVSNHRELLNTTRVLQDEIDEAEELQRAYLADREKEYAEYARLMEREGKHMPNFDGTAYVKALILQDLSSEFDRKKKMKDKLGKLQSEIFLLERDNKQGPVYLKTSGEGATRSGEQQSSAFSSIISATLPEECKQCCSTSKVLSTGYCLDCDPDSRISPISDASSGDHFYSKHEDYPSVYSRNLDSSVKRPPSIPVTISEASERFTHSDPATVKAVSSAHFGIDRLVTTTTTGSSYLSYNLPLSTFHSSSPILLAGLTSPRKSKSSWVSSKRKDSSPRQSAPPAKRLHMGGMSWPSGQYDYDISTDDSNCTPINDIESVVNTVSNITANRSAEDLDRISVLCYYLGPLVTETDHHGDKESILDTITYVISRSGGTQMSSPSSGSPISSRSKSATDSAVGFRKERRTDSGTSTPKLEIIDEDANDRPSTPVSHLLSNK